MASLGELFVKIGIDATEFNRSITGMSKKLEEVGSKMKDVGGDLSTYITAPIVALGAGSIYAAGQMESLSNGLKAVMGTSEAAGAELEQLKEVAKLPGLGLKEVVQGSIRLQTIGFSAEKARDSMKAFGNAVATVGGGREQLEGALYGLQQLANTEFPLGEDLNIIKDAIPQVTPLLKEAFGTARTEELQKLGITSQMVVDTIITGLNKLPPVAGGVNNAFENLKDGGFNALATLGEGMLEIIPLEGIMNALSGALMSVANWFKELGPITKGIILTVVGLAAVAGPLLLALGTMATLLPVIASGWAMLSGMFSLAAIKTGVVTAAQWLYNAALNANPIGLVVAAIAALVAAFVIAWENSEKFRGVIKGLWAAIQVLATNIIDGFTKIPGIIIDAFKAIPKAIGDSFKGLGNLLKAVFAGDFKAIPDILKDLGKNIVKSNPLTGAAVALGKEFSKGMGDAFSDTFDKEIADATKKSEPKTKPVAKEGGVVLGKELGKGINKGLKEEVDIRPYIEELDKELKGESLSVLPVEIEPIYDDFEQEIEQEVFEPHIDAVIKQHKEHEAVVKKIKAVANEFAKKVGEAAKKLYKGITDGLKGLAAPITGGMESGGGALGALMEGNVIGALVSLFGDLAKESKGFAKLMEMINSVMSSVMTALAPAFDMLVTALHPLVGIIQSVMSTLGEMLISVLEPILPPLMQLLEIVAMLFEGLKPLVAAIGQLVGIILDVVIDLIEPLIEPLMGLFDMITLIVQALGPLIRIIGEILTPIFEIIGAILESVIAPILAIVAEILKVLAPILELVKLSMNAMYPILNSLAFLFKGIEISLFPIIKLFEYLGKAIQVFVDWLKEKLEKFGVNTDKLSQGTAIGGTTTPGMSTTSTDVDYSSYGAADTRQPVQVEGQLKVSGSDLIAVLNNAQKVRKFTT